MRRLMRTAIAITAAAMIAQQVTGPTGGAPGYTKHPLVSQANADPASVEQKVTAIISTQLGVDANKITAQASLTKDLGADELDIIELVMSIEEEFQIAIPDDAIDKIKTVGDTVALINAMAK